jgi:hypothetical protein
MQKQQMWFERMLRRSPRATYTQRSRATAGKYTRRATFRCLVALTTCPPAGSSLHPPWRSVCLPTPPAHDACPMGIGEWVLPKFVDPAPLAPYFVVRGGACVGSTSNRMQVPAFPAGHRWMLDSIAVLIHAAPCLPHHPRPCHITPARSGPCWTHSRAAITASIRLALNHTLQHPLLATQTSAVAVATTTCPDYLRLHTRPMRPSTALPTCAWPTSSTTSGCSWVWHHPRPSPGRTGSMQDPATFRTPLPDKMCRVSHVFSLEEVPSAARWLQIKATTEKLARPQDVRNSVMALFWPVWELYWELYWGLY